MSVDARKETFEHIELFGKPALFTNSRIDRVTVPENLHCYDLRGSDNDPGRPATVENKVGVNHAGTVLTIAPITIPKEGYKRIRGKINFLGECLDIHAFCEEHGIKALPDPRQFELRPASAEESGLFYALTKELDEELACIGHVRMDFGRGKEFWHSWWPRGDEALNSPEFKEELGQVVDELRHSVLKDLPAMSAYCYDHGGQIDGGWRQNYGYVLETEHYRYCLRCNPEPGDYQGYLIAFDKRQQELNLARKEGIVGRVSFVNGEAFSYTDGDEYIAAVREELPYQATTGFRFETITDDPEVRKAVDDMVYDLYGEENPRPIEDYENEPDEGMTMGGMSL